jgi:glycerol-3-phosphate dehydrogenase
MKHISTDVLVVGGGATGTGVLRDLAMRGIRCALVEKRDLAYGTTGRYHGLLHSGGRYVVKDPQAAHECIIENRILRKIMPFCIEDTGGFFVTTPWDDPAFAEHFVRGCQTAGIPYEEIGIGQMLKEEPLLNPAISRCFRVPDASADSFLAAEANVISAEHHGAQTLTYHEVKRLIASGNRVHGAVCHDLVKDEEVQIEAGVVVNASGAWAGKIASSLGLDVQIRPGKGTMVAINHRILNTVINRCKMPSDGDIIVPAHTVAVIGTTDEQVQDADHFSIEPWEIRLMLEEGEKLVPGLQEMRMLRAWAGVRPLYQETAGEGKVESRHITRAYVLLDHEMRDGVSGLVTITSGKWTTYRMMAEATADLVAKKVGNTKPCRTHIEVLPSPEDDKHSGLHWLGSRLAAVEQDIKHGSLICECELVTETEVTHSITKLGAKSIDDIRRDTRLGMGPCQGGFCTLRVAGLLHHHRKLPVAETNASLRDFLQERWKGLLPVLWGQQLRQERLDELIYLDVLNVPGLPGPDQTRLASENYADPVAESTLPGETQPMSWSFTQQAGTPGSNLDALVIGAGLAGMAATWLLASDQKRVHCISKGWGAQYWASGCIDVLAHSRSEMVDPTEPLRSALTYLVQNNPTHPYAVGGIKKLEQALVAFQNLCQQAGYPMHAAQESDILRENWLIPTTLGSLRQTCLAPQTMLAGDCRFPSPARRLVLVGFEGYPDFYAQMAAENLSLQGIPTCSIHLDIPVLTERKFLTSRILAQHFEMREFRQLIARTILDQLEELPIDENEIRIGFPAVLGFEPSLDVWQELQSLLGYPVFELPGLPPSIPGMRLHQILSNAIRLANGRTFEGMLVERAELDGKKIKAVTSEAAARSKRHFARQYILATGGILGGGFKLTAPRPGETSHLKEIIFNTPLVFPDSKSSQNSQELFRREFLHPEGHTLFKTGCKVDGHFRILEADGEIFLDNLYAIGGALAGADPVREGSLEGIALLSALVAAETIKSTSANQTQDTHGTVDQAR